MQVETVKPLGGKTRYGNTEPKKQRRKYLGLMPMKAAEPKWTELDGEAPLAKHIEAGRYRSALLAHKIADQIDAELVNNTAWKTDAVRKLGSTFKEFMDVASASESAETLTLRIPVSALHALKVGIAVVGDTAEVAQAQVIDIPSTAPDMVSGSTVQASSVPDEREGRQTGG